MINSGSSFDIFNDHYKNVTPMIIKGMNPLTYYKALPYKSTNQILKFKEIILRH